MPPTVLVLTPWLPEPRTAGDRIDIASHVDVFVAQGWRVVFIACGEEATEGQRDDVEFHGFPLSPGGLVRERLADVQAIVDRHRPRLVWTEYVQTVKLAEALDLHGAPVWFRVQNFELVHQFEKAGLRGRLAQARWLASHRPWKYFSLERRMLRLAQRAFFISLRDQRAMPRICRGGAEAAWLPPIVEREPVPVNPSKHVLDVLYVGSDLSVGLHASGADALAGAIAPAVEKALPGRFSFHIVGRAGRAWAAGRTLPPSVHVHDFVEDLDAFHRAIDIVTVPVRVGWGCKIKMVDGMARGLPVVGAETAFRALPPCDGAWFACRDVAEYVEAFRALESPEVRARTGRAGRIAYDGWREEGRRTLERALDELRSGS